MVAPTIPYLLALRDTITKDPLALQKWAHVVDQMVGSSPPDVLRLKAALRDGSFEEAVLQSLLVFFGDGGTREELAGILAGLGLNAIAAQIQESEVRSPHVQQTEADCATAMWREVGKLIGSFSGRTHVIETLHSKLHAPENRAPGTANMITISGLGGVGKSTLVRKYAYDYRNDYGSNVLWINAETVDSTRASFIRLAKGIGLNLGDQISDSLLVEKVFAHFKRKNCLLIFDNVEDKSDYKRFLPGIQNPDYEMPFVVVTSRRTDLNPLPGNEIQLDVLEMKEAVDLIQNQLPKAKREDALKLAEKLQRFPLALQQALAYIRDKYVECEESIVKYLEEFEKSEVELLKDERFRDHNDYSSTTLATWQTTLGRIREYDDGQHAIAIISSLAYLNPDSTSTQFMRTLFEEDTEPGLRLLNKFSMVRVSEGKVSIHRLLQHVVRLSFCEREEQVIRKLAEAIRREFNKEGRKLGEVKRECTSHSLHMFPCQMKDKDPEAVTTNCDYFDDLCYFLIEYGNYDECFSVSQQMAALYESANGEEHESTIRMKWRMADAYSFMGKYSDSFPILNSILPVAKSTLGSECRVTMAIQSRLANNLSRTGDSEKAVWIYNEMIPVAERVFGENHGNVLLCKARKARALRMLRKYDQALELLQHVIYKREMLHGEGDVRTLHDKFEIAAVHYGKRVYSKALRIWEVVEVGYGNALGDTHPDTVEVRKWISICKAELARRERSYCRML